MIVYRVGCPGARVTSMCWGGARVWISSGTTTDRAEPWIRTDTSHAPSIDSGVPAPVHTPGAVLDRSSLGEPSSGCPDNLNVSDTLVASSGSPVSESGIRASY